MQHVDFTFAKPWSHAGVEYAKGDHASFPPKTADKLRALGAGSYAKEPPRRYEPKASAE